MPVRDLFGVVCLGVALSCASAYAEGPESSDIGPVSPHASDASDVDVVREVSTSEVQIKRRPAPKYPSAAKKQNLPDSVCTVRFFVNQDGVPYDVSVESGPEIFHENTLAAAKKWRFEPYVVDEEPVNVQFVVNFKFQKR